MNERPFPAVGEVIRGARKSQQLSLRKLSEIIGVDFSHIHNVERGTRGASRDVLDKISSGLGLDRDHIYVAAGFWPPSIPASPYAVDFLRQFIQSTKTTVPSVSRHALRNKENYIDKLLRSREVLIS